MKARRYTASVATAAIAGQSKQIMAYHKSAKTRIRRNARRAEINGDRATVRVTTTNAEGREQTRDIHLRHTDAGWLVSGRSLNDLVRYVITRLEERF